MLLDHVRRVLYHGSTGEGRRRVTIVKTRFGIHALDGSDVTQVRVGSRLGELGSPGVRSRVVRDEVEMLARRRGDTERLLHETVGFVLVALGATVVLVLVASSTRVGGFCCASSVVAKPAAPLALHLTVGKKASRNPAGTPRLAVSPPPHAGFALVPNENRPGPDGLPLLLR